MEPLHSVYSCIRLKLDLKMSIAVFPGSFDPLHNGHVDIVHRLLPLFDKVVIAVGINQDKKYLFSLEQRVSWLQEVFAAQTKIEIKTYEGLTVKFCKKENANFIIRGLRTSADFEFERSIAQLNKSQAGVESVFVISTPENAPISSTILRDIYKNKGDISQFIPFKLIG
jgi:pantetheine-phosphate adenylyltransferase